jgi:hypothetical protein
MAFDELLELGHELGVEVLGHLVGAVPVGVVGAHHGDAVAGAAAFVVPDFVPGEVDGVADLGGAEEGFGGLVEGDAGFGELLVVEIDEAVVLLVEVSTKFWLWQPGRR